MDNNPYYVKRSGFMSDLVGGAQNGMGLVNQIRQAKQQQDQHAMQQQMEAENLKQAQFLNTPVDAPPELGLPATGTGLPLGNGIQGPTNQTPAKWTMGQQVPWMEKKFQMEEGNKNRNLQRDLANQGKNIGYANQFRDEFNTNAKTFRTVVPMYKNIVSAATNPNPSAQSDMSLIFAYMKLLDPNSTVREGEYATAEKAGSVPQALWNVYNKAKDGQKLQPEQRIGFANEAKKVFGNNNAMFHQDMGRYTDLAKRRGVDPNDVVYDYGQGLGNEQFGAPAVTAPNVTKDKSGVIYID